MEGWAEGSEGVSVALVACDGHPRHEWEPTRWHHLRLMVDIQNERAAARLLAAITNDTRQEIDT
jgi:hypothetical protein